MHPFFKDVDWNLLEKKGIQPPFRPKIEQSNELNNFAKVFIYFIIKLIYVVIKVFTDEVPKETPVKNSKTQNYSDFTYIKQ